MKNLGKYELLGELGRGAFGIVYRARDPVISRMVALKTMTTSVADNPALLERFYREARALMDSLDLAEVLLAHRPGGELADCLEGADHGEIAAVVAEVDDWEELRLAGLLGKFRDGPAALPAADLAAIVSGLGDVLHAFARAMRPAERARMRGGRGSAISAR